MKKNLWACLALAGLAVAQLAAGSIIKADLTTEIESANAQVGDQVSAATTEKVKQGKVTLPKGTVINGHVIAVTPAPDNHSPGSVSVLFNQAVTPKGETVAILAGVASVKMPSSGSSNPLSRGGGMGGRRGGYGRGGGGGAPPSSSAPVNNTPPDIRFPSDAATKGSVLSKQSGDVWLTPGTHVTLQIIAEPAAAPAAGGAATPPGGGA